MTVRTGPLRAAAALAVGFVAVRVVYRVLFHGVDGGGAVLADLPAFRLPEPLDHVELLGPITTGGLASAVVSALPVAAVILAFGVLNAVLDLPRLLARGARSGPFRGWMRALAIAWATLPSLLDGVRAVRFAQRLRGERAGIRLLSPVLERTVERAAAVGAALELRGYAGRGLRGDCARPVELDAATAGFGDTPVVDVRALSLAPGELVVVAGDTGSGKSTLLRTLSGLHTHLDGGVATGTVRVVGRDRLRTPPRDTALTVGTVLQHPRESFAAERVSGEIALGMELRGLAPVLREARVREVAERLGITHLLDRPLRELSAGEATLVAIAAAVAEDPVLLLVDEPLADLDDTARERVVSLLAALARDAGICVVVAEHRVGALAAHADRILHVDDGGLTSSPPPRTPSGLGIPAGSGARSAPRASPTSVTRDVVAQSTAVALRVTDLTVRHGDRIAVDAASLTLVAGECVALAGPNGAGKSSLLVALATRGGEEITAAGRVALVPDASDDLFIRQTVAAECRRADRRSGSAPGTTAERFARLVGAPLGDLLPRHPRDLSAGQRRCLAIVLQTALRPAVLLVDEPTRGLDPAARRLVAGVLRDQAAAGAAVLFATHDHDFAAEIAGRGLAMSAGVLTAGSLPVSTSRSPVTNDAPRRRVVTGERIESGGGEREGGGGVRERGGTARRVVLGLAQIAALGAFCWPLLAAAVPADAQAAVPAIALALAPLAVVVALAALDESVRSAQTLALLAVLAAVGAAVRIASTGVGGVEALFILLILAGRVLGPRFGLLLGASAVALSAVLWGGVGPWLPFQMFACGWVAAGAGLLPRSVRGRAEIAMLCAYGIVSSYLFGLVMNLWFWPFAVGGDTSISYVAGAPLGENLGSFLVYSLVTSTATWDTMRAVTTVVGVLVVGRAVLAALRRAKPVTTPSARAR